jgi:DNA processing protein
MAERGPIISRFANRTFPAPQNFPISNWIIAGMTLGTAVIREAQYSGSLITARLAMGFGREVSSVPGNATQPSHIRPNQLTMPGDQLVIGSGRCVDELPIPVCAEPLPVETAIVGSACQPGGAGSGANRASDVGVVQQV